MQTVVGNSLLRREFVGRRVFKILLDQSHGGAIQPGVMLGQYGSNHEGREEREDDGVRRIRTVSRGGYARRGKERLTIKIDWRFSCGIAGCRVFVPVSRPMIHREAAAKP